MAGNRFVSVLVGGGFGLGLSLLLAACEQEGASSPSRVSSDVTTTGAIVAGPAAQSQCSRGEVRAWNNGESLCVRSCATAGGCPDGHAARRCAANQLLAGAPDSNVDYCLEKR
jgi:hypothetical protein